MLRPDRRQGLARLQRRIALTALGVFAAMLISALGVVVMRHFDAGPANPRTEQPGAAHDIPPTPVISAAPASPPAAAASVTQPLPVSDAVWQTSLPTPSGTPVTLAKWRGTPLVLNFWASWCGPCVREMPELVALHHQFAAAGVQFAGIGADHAENIKNFLQRIPVDYPVLIADAHGIDIARELGDAAGALPYTVVIDRDGQIRWSHLGTISSASLSNAIQASLARR